MSIATRIRKSRRDAGLSQSQLAKLMKVTRSACSQWEQPDGTAPRGSRLQRLATLLGVTVEWLATGEGDASGARTAEAPAGYRKALTDDERALLDGYAALDRDGREALLTLVRRLGRRKRKR